MTRAATNRHSLARAVGLMAALVLGGCSWLPAPQMPAGPASAAPSLEAVGLGPCGLLTDEEVTGLLGEQGSEGRVGATAGVQNCQWSGATGRWVQVVSIPAQNWARSLPDLVRAAKSSGVLSDEENLERLEEAAGLVEAGKEIGPAEACSLFSTMIEEFQGMPAGSDQIVTLLPTGEDPMAVTSQVCREGRYTSVMVADRAGFEDTAPLEERLEELAGVVSVRAQEDR